MTNDDERNERDERARRLRDARERAGFSGQKAVAEALNINVNTYKAHENGRNGFGVAAAQEYARLFRISAVWLYMNVGSPDDVGFLGNNEQLRKLFERIASAPKEVRNRIASYATFELGRIDTATNLDS
jgi:DNA-binding XRE family transcriptional regulator